RSRSRLPARRASRRTPVELSGVRLAERTRTRAPTIVDRDRHCSSLLVRQLLRRSSLDPLDVERDVFAMFGPSNERWQERALTFNVAAPVTTSRCNSALRPVGCPKWFCAADTKPTRSREELVGPCAAFSRRGRARSQQRESLLKFRTRRGRF